MPKSKNQYEELAREAVERVDQARSMGQQLSLLPDADEGAMPDPGGKAVGRPAGAKNKGSSQLRDWLSARGLRMPEDQLVQIAGLAAGEDVITKVIADAERILAWAADGAVNRVFIVGTGHVDLEGPWKPSPGERIDLFKFLYTATIKANEALMPFVAPKATPDVIERHQTTILMPMAGQPGDGARVIDGRSGPVPGGRMAPPPLPGENEQKQQVSNSDPDSSDGENSDGGASD